MIAPEIVDGKTEEDGVVVVEEEEEVEVEPAP